MKEKSKKIKRERRHKRVRGKISGTAKRPRLCVFRSNEHIYAQLIDDENNKVLASASDLNLKKERKKKMPSGDKKEQKKELSAKIKISFEVGKAIAQKAKEKDITAVVFDRAGYKYHGRVKSLAEGARDGGLNF